MDPEPLARSESHSLHLENPESGATQNSRAFAEGEKGGWEEDSFRQGQSLSPKEPPERWGEFFARSGAGSSSRGVGGKGVKRHPSGGGDDIVIRSGARISPPARGSLSSRGLQRARSPDDLYPPGENVGCKGRSLVSERGLGDLRSRRGAVGACGSKGGKKHGEDAGGLWPLVVGLQEEARAGCQPQHAVPQNTREDTPSASYQSSAQPEWSPWFDRPPQLHKTGFESSDSEPHFPDDICFPVQRRRLSNNTDQPNIASADDSPTSSPFSFGPPGFGRLPRSEPVQNPHTLSPSDGSPRLSNNPFAAPFAFPPPPSIADRVQGETNPMDTDPPPALVPPSRTPVHFDDGDSTMPGLVNPSLGLPPPPAPHFTLPPPGPRSHFLSNRRGPGGNLFPQPSGPGSSRGVARAGTRPPPPWYQHPPVVFDGLAEANQSSARDQGPLSDFGRPFSEVGVAPRFSATEPPASPFTLLPVHGETGDPTLSDAPMRAPAHRAPSPGLFDDLDPLRQLRRLSPGERPREAYQDGFGDRSPLRHQDPSAPRIGRHASPPADRRHVAHTWRAPPAARMRDMFDEWEDWDEGERADVDMDGSWWDMEAGGGGPERRARSPPRRTSDPGFRWLEEPLWEGGADSLDEAGGDHRPNAGGDNRPNAVGRRGPMRRRRFSLFDEEGTAARTNAPGLDTLAPEPAAMERERVAAEDSGARRRGRSWLREVNSLEGGSVRPPGASAANVSRSAREGLFMARRGVGPLGPPPPPPLDPNTGRPPVYRNLREFLSEAGAPPPLAPRRASDINPTAEDDPDAGRNFTGLYRDGSGVQETEAAIGRARARRHRARLFEGREGGLPPPLLAMLNALEEAEQFQDLSGDQLIRLQIALAGGGMSARRRRELDAMRVDVDRMTYEELLELEERIGNVSVGLSPETVVEKLPITKWQCSAGGAPEVKCVVCQVEYEESEDVRILPCTHCYHADCIKSWLATKNECPVCKAKAVP